MYLKDGLSLLLSLKPRKRPLPFVLNTKPLLNHDSMAAEVPRNEPSLRESEVLNRLENEPNVLLALDYFKTISNSKAFKQTGLTYRTMIRRLGDEGNVDDVQYLLQQMKLEGVPCNVDMFVNVIKSYAKMGLAEQGSKMLYRISEFGCKPTVKVYNLLLDALLSENKFDLVSATYRNMKADQMEPNVYTYNILLKAMCKNNRVDAAQKLLLQMSNKGCNPDVVSYTTVVSCMCNLGKVDEAKELATKFQPSVPTYNALIKGFTTRQRIPEALQLFDQMVEEGVAPNVITYSTVMSALSDTGNVELALAVFGKMFIRGCSPNPHTFSSLLKGYFREGRFHEALDLWDRMVSEGSKPNIVVYNTLIHGLCSCGRMEESVEVVNNMEHNGLSASITTYGSLIDGFAKSGDILGASETWNKMMKDGACVRNVVVYTSMVDALCRNSMFREAHSLMERMAADKNCLPNTVTFNMFVKHLAGSGRTEWARRVFEGMGQYACSPDVTTYNELLDGFLKTERIKEGLELFKEMDENESIYIKPDLMTYNSVLHSVCRAGMLSIVLQLIGKMIISGVKPDALTFNTMIDAYSRQGKVDTAIQLTERLSCGGYWSPDIVAYTNILWGVCHSFGLEKASSFLEKMVDNSIFPNVATWNVLVRGFFNSLGHNLGSSVSLLDDIISDKGVRESCLKKLI